MNTFNTLLALLVITLVNANESSSKVASLLCEFDESSAICELLADNLDDDVKITAVYDRMNQINLTSESIDTNAMQERVKFMEITKTRMSLNIPQNVGGHFENLESFRITKTSLKFVARKPLENLVNLRHLSLDSNKIEIIYGDAFNDLVKLTSLYISNNKIDFLHPQLFVNCPRLRYFWCDYNKLEQIDGRIFENSKEIEWINLSHNRIVNVGIDFRELKKLIYVNLERNRGSCSFIFDEFLSNNASEKNSEFQEKVDENCKN
jgi:Leucine-rich repeat (LRR) protein